VERCCAGRGARIPETEEQFRLDRKVADALGPQHLHFDSPQRRDESKGQGQRESKREEGETLNPAQGPTDCSRHRDHAASLDSKVG
jgi:hypothetical protein